MRRVLFFLLFLFPSLSFALDLDIEARAAWLIPKSHTMREVYAKGIPEYALELGFPLNRCFTIFTNISYFEAKGHSTLLKHRTSVENVGCTLGGKYYFLPWCLFRPYFGLGVGGAHIRFFDKSPFVKRHVNRLGWSFLAKVGTEMCFSRYFYADFFADYSIYSYSFKNKKGLSGHHLNAGGAKVGAGLGIRF